MIFEMLDDAISAFERLIELLQDAGVDTDIVTMVEDAKEVLEDRYTDVHDDE